MGRVRIGDHLWLNLSRRSQCDNCAFELCLHPPGYRKVKSFILFSFFHLPALRFNQHDLTILMVQALNIAPIIE